jgi:hypothetical protein
MFPFTVIEYNSRALSKNIYIKYAFIYKCAQPDAYSSMAIDFYYYLHICKL